MKIFHKVIVVLMLACAMLLSTIGSCLAEETIKLGYIGDLSSSDAYIAQAGLYAVQDYVEELNANGGLLGMQVEIVPYDIGRQNEEVVNVVNKLIYMDRVSAIIGPTASVHAIAATPIVTQGQVPMVSIAASNPSVTVDANGKVQPFVFRVCMIDPYQGTALADFAYNELGAPVTGTIAPLENSYSQGLVSYFVEHYEALGGQVAKQLGYRDGEVEFRAQLTDLASEGVQCLFVTASAYRDAVFMVQQAQELGLDFTWLFGDAIYAQELIDNVGEALEGKCYISTGITESDGTYDEYYAAFNAKHSDKTANIYALYAMDAMKAIEYAINTSGSKDPVAIRDALENMVDVPVFTCSMTMEPDTHNPHNKPVSIITIQNGTFELYKVYTPQD